MITKKEEMDLREKLLDEYEKNAGLPANISPGVEAELQEYFTMNKDVIEKLTAERALSISIRLSQYSIYITRLLNKEKGRKVWATDELNRIIAKSINEYDKYMKSEYKVASIIQENAAAKVLSDITTYANQRIERLNEIASGINSLSYVFSLAHKQKIGESHVRHN